MWFSKNGSHPVTQICHFMSLFQKLFLQCKNIFNMFYLDYICHTSVMRAKPKEKMEFPT